MAGLTGLLPGDTYGQLLYIGASNVGIEATAKQVYSGLGIASPLLLTTTQVSLLGTSARIFGMERHTTADTAGNNLTINAGGATSGATDKNGGDTYITSGIATGSGSSNIYFQTATAGAAGTADRAVSTKMTILGNGNMGIGTTSPTKRVHILGKATETAGTCLLGVYSNGSLGSGGSVFEAYVGAVGLRITEAGTMILTTPNINLSGAGNTILSFAGIGNSHSFTSANTSQSATDWTFNAGKGTGSRTAGNLFAVANNDSVKLTLNYLGYLGIGLVPTANMAGISIEAGIITLKETTTPTADNDYGKIYFKSDNKMYCQTGHGVEHEIAFI